MTDRFDRLENVRNLSEAAANYRAWREARATAVPRVGQGTARGRSARVALLPFGFDPGTGVKVIIRSTDRSNTVLASGLGTHISATIGANDRTFPGFVPAKVIVFQGTGSSRVVTSEITRRPYLKRSGESYTHGFGAATATEKELEALNDITTDLLAQNQNRIISYQPERQRKV